MKRTSPLEVRGHRNYLVLKGARYLPYCYYNPLKCPDINSKESRNPNTVLNI